LRDVAIATNFVASGAARWANVGLCPVSGLKGIFSPTTNTTLEVAPTILATSDGEL